RSVRGPRTGQPLPRSEAPTAGRDASRAPPRPRYASRMTRVLVLNGPNLGRLGVREPEVYGHATLADLRSACEGWAAELGLEADVRQTDDESQIVAWLHEAVDTRSDVVLNPAAFTHYSYALRDAAAQVTDVGLRLVEVHISNPYAR